MYICILMEIKKLFKQEIYEKNLNSELESGNFILNVQMYVGSLRLYIA